MFYLSIIWNFLSKNIAVAVPIVLLLALFYSRWHSGNLEDELEQVKSRADQAESVIRSAEKREAALEELDKKHRKDDENTKHSIDTRSYFDAN